MSYLAKYDILYYAILGNIIIIIATYCIYTYYFPTSNLPGSVDVLR